VSEQNGPPLQTLTGIVERVTFHNPENGYTVAKLKVPREMDLVTVIGNFAQINAGESLRLRGHHANHPKHGAQFKALFCDVLAPATVVGLEKYLGSGLIKGVGPVTARRMVKHFGVDILEIIDREPERLNEVPGVGPKRVRLIAKAWLEQKAIKEVMVFLQGHGVSTTYAVKIYKAYGDDSIAVVTETPYRLADEIWGIGFITADRIARALGVPEDSVGRLRAGLAYVLGQASDSGHVFLPREDLLAQASEILKIDPELLIAVIGPMVEEKALMVEDEAVYLPALYYCEIGVANRLRALAGNPLPLDEAKLERELAALERHEALSLAARQRVAVLEAVKNRCFILTGGPGTGKTTTTRAILKLFERLGKRVLLASPTGRAAKRLSEVTGGEAKTLHRLLEFTPQKMAFARNAENPLFGDVIIVDEASMIDLTLTNSLLKAVPEGAQLLFVGDADQLPSVGAGRVLEDMLDSGVIPHARLTEVFRQAEGSQLVANAHRINQGLMPDLVVPDGQNSSDSYFVAVNEPEEVPGKIAQIVAKSLPRRFGYHAREDIQVLCPMNRGLPGANNLNMVLQDALNPLKAGDVVAQSGSRSFRVGDKVIQLRNNYDKGAFNGDTGIVSAIDLEEQEMLVDYWDNAVRYEFHELNELALAYAITVHKSQGSEYPVVVLPMTMQHYPMLQRNLLYTGLTRAKKRVVIVGTRKAIALALRNVGGNARHTRLAKRLQVNEG